jgi:flagellar basal body P-ring protein FlgI
VRGPDNAAIVVIEEASGTIIMAPMCSSAPSRSRRLGSLPGSTTLGDLVASPNALGIGPRDMISILQSIKVAGALQADVVMR